MTHAQYGDPWKWFSGMMIIQQMGLIWYLGFVFLCRTSFPALLRNVTFFQIPNLEKNRNLGMRIKASQSTQRCYEFKEIHWYQMKNRKRWGIHWKVSDDPKGNRWVKERRGHPGTNQCPCISWGTRVASQGLKRGLGGQPLPNFQWHHIGGFQLTLEGGLIPALEFGKSYISEVWFLFVCFPKRAGLPVHTGYKSVLVAWSASNSKSFLQIKLMLVSLYT